MATSVQTVGTSTKDAPETKVPALSGSDTSSVGTASEDEAASVWSSSRSISISSGSSANADEAINLVATDVQSSGRRNNSVDSIMATEWTKAKEEIVNKPYAYVSSLGGKGFRRQLLQALNVWLQVDEESCNIIDQSVAMLHNASLMIDDIQDNSKFRRTALATHEVYGVASTINSANYVYFQAQDKLHKLKCWPKAFEVFNAELMNLHRGQGMELYWRDNLLPPSEADYLQMIANKTGGLFRLILRLLQCATNCDYDLEPLVDVIGLMFQIMDDYKNLKDDSMKSQKGYCEDLTEGKFSYPVNHAVWTGHPRSDPILAVLKSKTENVEVKTWLVDTLERTGSFEYTLKRLEELNSRARQLIDGIPVRNTQLESLVETLIGSARKCS